MEENLLVHATERIAYGFSDTRALWGDVKPHWWSSIWMAVSSCCGLTGPCDPVKLPAPEPRLPQ